MSFMILYLIIIKLLTNCIILLFDSNLSDGVLGFDCEWVKEGPVSLLQLATFNGVVALFRIGKIGYIPLKLKVYFAKYTQLLSKCI